MTRILRGACLALACASMSGAGAAGNDELWEITSQMNMPGMPAGMGARTAQVCTEKGDQKKAMTQGNDKCKVTDLKQSGNSVHMAMSCPEGDAVMDTTYNAARTEYKGTMKMTSRQGEMTMTMNGRKVGSCDAKQAQKERDAEMAATSAQIERSQAQSAAMLAKMQDDQIKECAEAVETMQVKKLGLYERCNSGKEHAEACASQLKSEHSKRSATACMANAAEYCKRYQTMEGFTKAKGSEDGAATCKLSSATLKASFCPRAAQTENLAFLGRFCPVEAKPIAVAHCAGRGYTSKVKDKYTEFCGLVVAKSDLEDEDKPAQKKDAKAQITESVTQGVTQGVNKLKGLFGR
ncbi:MAG TPA: DUF3617 family protein [Burkholderiales bacterium]